MAFTQANEAKSSIVNMHWSLLYWEPMQRNFQKGEVSAWTVVRGTAVPEGRADLASERAFLGISALLFIAKRGGSA